ncbi:TPA: hypothetical protein ACIBOF_004810 [Salmonella enterica subsp. diarizonae serovar 61:r:-]
MKKLIIAAGIAAAAMASFNASAHNFDSAHSSWASLNTTVEGNSVVAVVATPAAISLDDIKADGKSLGKFTVQIPMGSVGIALSDMHSHGYPSTFKFKVGSCAVADTDGAVSAVAKTEGYDCLIDGTGNIDLDVTTNGTQSLDFTPGVKTISAKFTTYTN